MGNYELILDFEIATPQSPAPSLQCPVWPMIMKNAIALIKR
ncbi:hypothetical protein [Nostoc sp.]